MIIMILHNTCRLHDRREFHEHTHNNMCYQVNGLLVPIYNIITDDLNQYVDSVALVLYVISIIYYNVLRYDHKLDNKKKKTVVNYRNI
jgi:hypothetical protein